jgi:hypothetical protein
MKIIVNGHEQEIKGLAPVALMTLDYETAVRLAGKDPDTQVYSVTWSTQRAQGEIRRDGAAIKITEGIVINVYNTSYS